MQKATGDDIGSLDEELYFSTPRNNGTASPASTTPQCDPHANHTWDPSKKILFSTRTSLLGRDNTWNAHRGIEFASKAQYATKAALSKASPAGNSPVVLPYKSKLPPPTAYAPAKPRLTTRTRFDTQSDSMDQDEYTLKLTMDLKRMEENKTKAARARAVPLPATAHNRPSAPPSKIREEPQLASKSEGAEKVAIAQEAKERKASQASPLLVKQATTQTVTTSTNTAVTVPQIDKGKDYALKDLPKGTQDNARTTQDVLTVPVAALQFVSSTRPIIRTSGDTRNVVAPTLAKSTSTKRSGRIATQDAEHLPSIGRAVTQSKQISALYKPRGPESLRLLIDSIATEIEYLVAGSPLPRLTLLRAQRQHQLKFPTLQEIERERAAYLEKTTRESRLQLLVDQETARSRHLLAEIGASSRAIQRETYYGWKDVMNAYIFAATDAYWLIRELASVYGAQCGTWLPHREKIDNLFCYDLAIAQQELRSLKQLQTRLTRTQHLFRVISEDLKALDKLAADKARYWETLNYEVE
ncbi:hypothetical protein B0A49_00993 [Cryomyces minteri]|uniref:Uncharacterized protein n=1 Tax=Cryomyces minteri TaxID=331657 RepID=A0A4U0XTD1_9PEZI|nr:hypothetical protein B0A49_00993 [Cryomyces minteri]